MKADVPVCFVGHPYAPIGKGEELRANFRALASLDEPVQALDVYGVNARTDPGMLELFDSRETRKLPPGGVRVFHINGDEVAPVLAHLAALGSDFASGRNIVVPAWELPVYPPVWAKELARFDEVWAISRFVQESLAASGTASHWIGQSLDLPMRALLSRRYFGLRDSAFVFLAFLDVSSYVERKNPRAAIEMFKRLRARRPFDDLQLVLKIKGDEETVADFVRGLDLPRESFVLVKRLLSTHEQHSLIGACDCLVSLHRAEGFGRGPGEAMRLGRLALATGWSGNRDFMTEANSLLVNCRLVPVPEGAYIHGEGQRWAEPDIEHAAHLARAAIDDPAGSRRRAALGCDDVRRVMGDRAVGLRMLERLNAS